MLFIFLCGALGSFMGHVAGAGKAKGETGSKGIYLMIAGNELERQLGFIGSSYMALKLLQNRDNNKAF